MKIFHESMYNVKKGKKGVLTITFTNVELAKLVERLLNKRAEELLKRRWEEVMKSDAFIKDVHESFSSIDLGSFKLISESQTESGDSIIEWEAVEYLTTEFTVDEPYRFERKGKIWIRKDGEAELIEFY